MCDCECSFYDKLVNQDALEAAEVKIMANLTTEQQIQVNGSIFKVYRDIITPCLQSYITDQLLKYIRTS